MSDEGLVEGRGRVEVSRQQGGSGRRRREPVSKPMGAAGVRGREAVQQGGRTGPAGGAGRQAEAESGGRAAWEGREEAGIALLTRVSTRELCTGDPFVILPTRERGRASE